MIKRLAAAIALALPLSAFALSNSFSYQGSLNDGGSPASGSYDLQFQLQTSAGANVGAPLVREDVAVSGGLFSVELDFGAAITSADFRLQIGVRPGASTGAFTTLSPTTNLRPTPQAQVAGIASEAVTVSPNAITSASIADGSVGPADIDSSQVQRRVSGTCAAGSSIRDISATGTVTCETDDGGAGGGGTVTQVSTGSGLTGGPITSSGTIAVANGGITSVHIANGAVGAQQIALGSVGFLQIDPGTVQRRVGLGCAAGSSIRDISASGSVTCETDDDSGTVTNVASGAGLTGGPITTSGTLSIATGGVASAMIADGTVGSADINSSQVQARVTGTCAAGSSISAIAANGTVTCETDDNSGTVTNIASGAGLTGGPISTSGTLSIAANGVTSAMIADGTVGSADINSAQVQTRVSGACAAGSSISSIAANGTVSCESDDTGAPGWLLTGNSGTNSSAQFLGTTDFQPLVLRVNNTAALRIEPVAVSPNLIGGFSGNSATGVLGATIGGGGRSGDPNSVTDNFGTVGGGQANMAGDGLGSQGDRLFATVGGGSGNSASGGASTVGGGVGNTASRYGSTVSGGEVNTASGGWSTVSGGDANIASGDESTVSGGFRNCAGGKRSWASGFRAKVRPSGDPGGSGSCSGLTYPGGNGDQGTFVWADSQDDDFVSTGPNQFLVRAEGGVGINGAPATADLEMNVFGATPFDGFVEFSLIPKPSLNGNTGERVEFGVGKGGAGANDADLRIVHRNNAGGSGGYFEHLNIDGDGSVIVRSNPANTAQGVQLAIGAGAWSTLSDRNLKTDIEAILPLDVLERLVAMPIQQWRYIGQPGEVQHIGPMAQDFAAAFGVGENDTTISTVDADGVALAAIQGLNQKLESENAALRAELAELRALVLERVGD